MNDCCFFVEQALAVSHRSEAACRLVYLALSLILVTIDFLTRDFAFSEKPVQIGVLNDGFRYGTSGRKVAEKVFAVAGRLIASSSGKRNARDAEYASHLRNEAQGIPVEVLTEFIIKHNSGATLFDLARSFETLTYSRQFIAPIVIGSENRGFIGAVLDFFGIDRQRFFAVFVPVDLKGIATAVTSEPKQGIQLEPQLSTEQLEMKIEGRLPADRNEPQNPNDSAPSNACMSPVAGSISDFPTASTPTPEAPPST